MHIAILGATGRVGHRVANKLAEQHTVSALVRDSKKASGLLNDDINRIEGNVLDPEALRKTLEHADVVFSALGTDKTTTLSEFTPTCLEIMKEYNIPRIVTIGTAGILNSRMEEGKLRYQTDESKRRITFAAKEHEKVYREFENSDRSWTILCPTYLPDEESGGPLREEADYLPENGKRAPVPDVAEVAVREIISPDYKNKRVGLAL